MKTDSINNRKREREKTRGGWGATKRRSIQTRHNKLGLHKNNTRGKHETGQTRPDQARAEEIIQTDKARPDQT